jgi:hypothetical protein
MAPFASLFLIILGTAGERVSIFARGSRIRTPELLAEEALQPDRQTKQVDAGDCETRITQRFSEIVERIGAFFSEDCGIKEEQVEEIADSEGIVSHRLSGTEEQVEEARAAICKKTCVESPQLSGSLSFSDFDDLKAECADPLSRQLLEMSIQPVSVHNALSAVMSGCPKDAEAVSINTVLGEDANPPKQASPEEVKNKLIRTDKKPPTTSMVYQMHMLADLNNVFSIVKQVTCASLKKTFRMFDYQGTGQITSESTFGDYSKEDPKQRGGMFPKLSQDKTLEVFTKFHKAQEHDAKHVNFITFSDVVHMRLGVRTAMKCELQYALHNDA